MKIKIYSTPTCPYCIEAKKYFTENKIDFDNVDVSLDHHAADEMVKLSGQMGVPVITIDEKVIVGFDKPRIEKLLKWLLLRQKSGASSFFCKLKNCY